MQRALVGLQFDVRPLGVVALLLEDLCREDRGSGVHGLVVAETGATLPVQGAVDQASGRAAWIVGDNRTVVYETGISDLTQDQAPVLVHFSATVTEQWMLVRLPPPPSQ